MEMSRFKGIIRACAVVAQIAAVTLGGTDLAYAQCTQSSPCATLTKIGTGVAIGTGGTIGPSGIPEAFLPAFFRVTAISNDGSVVVGTARALNPQNNKGAFRWSRTGGLVELGAGAALDVNGDGSVVVGASDGGAFRWTSAGLVNLGPLGQSGIASNVSSDGSVLAGSFKLDPFRSGAFRWTSAAGLTGLGTLGGKECFGHDMSSDGSTVVGESELKSDSSPAPRHAFRWTSETGMEDLGTLGGITSTANATNSDGSVVVGSSTKTASINMHAFRWTKATGMVDIGTLSEVGITGATHISRDGSVVVGTSGGRAFRWTAATGMVDLGKLDDVNGVFVIGGVSRDGSVIVGNAGPSSTTPARPFRWTSAAGMQDLNALLSNAGVDMTGIRLKQAAGVSEDGKSIIGLGLFPGPPGAGPLGHGYIAHFNE